MALLSDHTGLHVLEGVVEGGGFVVKEGIGIVMAASRGDNKMCYLGNQKNWKLLIFVKIEIIKYYGINSSYLIL